MSELREIENALLRHDDPVVTVPELEGELPHSDTHIRDSLKLLEREGVVHSKNVGARAVAWWHSERVTAPLVPADEHPEQSRFADHERPQPPAEGQQRDETADGSDSATVDPLNPVDSLDLPGSGVRLEDRTEAMNAVVNYLGRNGETGPSELKGALYEDYPAGYDSARSWWKNLVMPALKDLQEAGVVELVDPHDGLRRLAGDGR